jgi:putative membrane protein
MLVAFILIACLLGLHPWYRRDWALENLIVVVSLPVLVHGFRKLRFSNGAYFAIFVLFVAHEVGAHYTYAEVPYDTWSMQWLGFSITKYFDFSRNHYDRLVHFLYGVLATPALLEIIRARMRPQGIWIWLLPLSLVLSQAALYELLEWAAALIFGGELGQAYLGTQGDPWDAHQDMALAPIGALLTLLYLRLRRRLHPISTQVR